MASKRIHLVLAALMAVGILAGAGLRAQSRSNDNEDEREVLRGSFVVAIHVNEGALPLKFWTLSLSVEV